MSFVHVQQRLITDRKTLRLARLLGIDRYAVVGRLVALWSWCLDNAPDGRLTDDVDAEMLAEVMGWDASFGTPDKLLDELLAVGFLDVDPQDGALIIHNWVDSEVAPRAADAMLATTSAQIHASPSWLRMARYLCCSTPGQSLTPTTGDA